MYSYITKISTALALALSTLPLSANNDDKGNQFDNERETEGYTLKLDPNNTDSKFLKAVQPSLHFGGYIVGKYSISDRSQQKSNGGFSLRYVRLYADGKVYKDFYYKFQLEVNGAPGEDKGPRVVDAFIEWQKFDFLRVKLGQFKRPFGFENPYNPLNVGYGCYSQINSKLASLSDRNGEHKSSGRDLGIQLQGDLFKANDGHKWIHYQLGFFNGQGINHNDKDHHKDFIGGLWFSPIKDLAIGGFGWNGKYTNEKYDPTNEKHLKSVKRVRWGAGLKYESDWTIRGEYMSSVGGVVTDVTAPDRSDGWYATIGVPVMKNLKIYGRYDCYRDNKEWNSLRTDYGISGNYKLGKNLIFQLNYTFTDDRSARNSLNPTDSHYNTFDVQVAARF